VKIEKKYFIVLLFLFVGFFTTAHPYYVSICQVEFNRQTHALEISLKTFADDLLLGLENAGHSNIYIGEPKENPKTDEFIYNYLLSKLNFKVDGNPVEYKFVGKEMEDGVVWTYLEIINIQEFTDLDVSCTLLTEVLASQSNIIQVEKDKKIKNLLLNRNKTSGNLTFGD